jgi:prepilin-type N-terminal cleavage/methylation domain-containing protein
MVAFIPAVNDFVSMFKTILVGLLVFDVRKRDDSCEHKLRPNRLFSANQKGFTLLEIISVLIIMSVIISVGIKKLVVVSDSASMTALKAGVRELNTREVLEWSKIKLSDIGYTNDLEVYNAVDKNLGPRYRWQPLPTISNGTLHYDSTSLDLNRTASTTQSFGSWN